MNSVERIKKLCKERKVSISRLERECGFANGYIGQLRKGTLPADRLKTVADYFGISMDELLESEEGEQTVEEKQAELNAYLDELKNDPEQKILFELAQGATKEQLQATVTFLRMLRGETEK